MAEIHRLVLEENFPASDVHQVEDGFSQSGLAAAAFPHQGKDFSFFYG
jgi:hypothetical protein